MTKRLSVALAGLLVLAACSEAEQKQESTPPTKVGFIYIGPHTDYGWSKSHEDGRLYLNQWGTNVDTDFKELVLPSQAPAVIDEMVAAGRSIIFANSFDFLGASLEAPARHPGLWMFNCSGLQTANHVGSYMGRMEEAEYLAGMLAGLKLKEANGGADGGKIGIVGALKIYEQMVHINAFTLGLRSVNPTATVHVRWIGNWFNPAMEEKAVEALVSTENVDGLQGLTDTTIPMTKAASLDRPGGGKVFTLGYDNRNYCDNSPETCIGSAYLNWGPLYVKLVEEVQAGTYPANGRIDYLGMKDIEITGLAVQPAVDDAIESQVELKRQAIANGSFNVFQGPFNKQAGTAWLTTSSEVLTDTQLNCTQDFVEGVVENYGPGCDTNGQADCGEDKVPGTDLYRLECKAGVAGYTGKVCVPADLTPRCNT